MQRRQTVLVVLVTIVAAITGIVIFVALTSSETTIQTTPSQTRPSACRAGPPQGQTSEVETAKLIIEYNATDQDLGVHGAVDSDGWKTFCLFDPNGRPVLEIGPRGQLLNLGVASVFFESREPPESQFSLEDLAAAFPEGTYTVRGESFDGRALTGEATFTHDVPAAPEIRAPVLAEEAETAEAAAGVPLDGMVVTWDEVTETVDGGSVNITGYQVVVTKEVAEDPHGFSRPPIYDVHVPPTVTELSVATEFLEPDTVYELEVLALEESGNQTISVGFFKTA
jgi:hypothetical protein